MLFFAQVLLALFGICVLLLGKLPLGDREVRKPLASLIGLILAVSMPLTVVLITVLSAPDMAKHAKLGLDKAYQLATEGYWWVRPAMLVLSLGAAGGLAYIGLRNEQEPLPSAPIAPSDALEKSGTLLGNRDGIVSAAPPWTKPAAEPTELPPVVGRYTAPDKAIPPEVEALGNARKLFRPSSVGGLVSWWAGQKPASVLVFEQALVTVTGDDFVVVPWNAIESLAGRTLKTTDGQSVPLPEHVEEAARLEQIVRRQISDRLLAAYQPRLDAGEEVAFGAITITAEELRYNDRSLPWFEIGHVRIFEGRSLHVTSGGSPLPWCMVPREKIANEFLLLELIAKLAPGSVQMSWSA